MSWLRVAMASRAHSTIFCERNGTADGFIATLVPVADCKLSEQCQGETQCDENKDTLPCSDFRANCPPIRKSRLVVYHVN